MVGKWIGAAPTQTTLANSGVFSISDINKLKDENEYILDYAFECEYLVVGGAGHSPGGFSGGYGAGGGGGGGLRNSYASENTGGGGSTEAKKSIILGQEYTVTIGAGSTNVGTGDLGFPATASQFDTIYGYGGGNGNRFGSTVAYANAGFANGPGQAGRATSGTFVCYLVEPVQGYIGGNRSGYTGGAGGGAASAGGAGYSHGAGLFSAITGTSTTEYGRGGDGGGNNTTFDGTAGIVNTGSAGRAGRYSGAGYGSTQGGAGGSGIVILRYPNTYTISVGVGLTHGGEQADGSDKYIRITGGTDTVSWS
jgi:hypothetical protein